MTSYQDIPFGTPTQFRFRDGKTVCIIQHTKENNERQSDIIIMEVDQLNFIIDQHTKEFTNQ